MKIRIVTGFGDDQKYTIDGDEAHKAYYLFRNPEKRGVFSNGLALVGKDIRAIQPDWNATMGWNQTHKLDEWDWKELEDSGIVSQMRALMGKANAVAYQIETNHDLLNRKLEDISKIETPKEIQKLTEGINKSK